MDWDRIEKTANELIEWFEPYEVVSDDEWNLFRWSWLTYGQVKSSLRDKVNYGHSLRVKGGVDDELRRDLLAWQLRFSDEPSPVPSYLSSDRVNHVDIVRRAISQREMTTEFLIAWGRLHEMVATYEALVFREADFDDLLKAEKGGFAQSTEIQKCWYAHWVASYHWRDRGHADNELQGTCGDIVQGKRVPAPPYPVDWFLRVVAEPAKRQGKKLKPMDPRRPDRRKLAIVDRITRLSDPTLEELRNHPVITKDVLPPLNRSDFKLKKPSQ